MSARPARQVQSDQDATPVRRLLLLGLDVGDAAIDAGRKQGLRLLDALTAQLKTLRLRIDPELDQWIADANTSVANGSMRERIRTQPTPQALAEELKQARRTD